MGRSLVGMISGMFMNGGLALMGVAAILIPILLVMQILAPSGAKPLTWTATQIAHADYAEGQGEIELHAQKRLIDIRLDEMEILNKKLAEIEGQLHEDQKWWDTNCGLVSAFDNGFGTLCNDVSRQRYDPAFSALGGEQDQIKQRLREIEAEILRMQRG